MASRDTIARIIGVLAQFFPGFAARQTDDTWEGMITAYYLVLYDLDGDLIERAAIDLGCCARYFPSAGELRQTAWDLADLSAGIPTAQDAWAEVSSRLRTGFYVRDERGFYQRRAPTPDDWSHPLIQKAIDGVGGWQALNDPQGLAAADRARFLEAYQVYAGRDRRDRAMLPVVRQIVERDRDGARVCAPSALPRVIQDITERGVPILAPRALELEPA